MLRGLATGAAALGWLNACLPDRVYLEPEQALVLPRFGWVEPLRLHGSQNVVSTRAVGSYPTTLALGGWLPVKTIRTVVTTRPSVTVCGTPFGVKMFSEGALIVGFSDVDRADGGTANPAKAAGLHLGDRVVCIGETATENNDAVKAALDAAQGAEAAVAVQQAAGSDPYFPDHGDARYRVHRYELALDYRPAPNRLAGSARINAIAGRSPLAEFMLNLSDFKIGRVRVDGRPAHYTHRGGKLRVKPAKAVRPGAASRSTPRGRYGMATSDMPTTSAPRRSCRRARESRR